MASAALPGGTASELDNEMAAGKDLHDVQRVALRVQGRGRPPISRAALPGFAHDPRAQGVLHHSLLFVTRDIEALVRSPGMSSGRRLQPSFGPRR